MFLFSFGVQPGDEQAENGANTRLHNNIGCDAQRLAIMYKHYSSYELAGEKVHTSSKMES